VGWLGGSKLCCRRAPKRRAEPWMSASFFAYGSLLWERSLPFVVARTPAVLQGHRRLLCMYSWTYRGTREAPGLVLGLEAREGSSCVGAALRVHDEQEALQYFDERELINGIYNRRLVKLATADGEGVAHAYVADSSHEQYCGDLPLPHAANLVATGVGTRGTALEYLSETVAALRVAKVHEPSLESVLAEALRLRRERCR
jgi:cation transport protein ChaC